jgi:hypothetical protein
VATLRTRLWAVRVPEPIVELTFANAHRFGIDPEALVDDDWTACQALAARVYADPNLPDTLCVPSAALPGSVNYVLFGPRIAIPFDAPPVDVEDLSTAHAAEDARALETVLGSVCFRGMAHAGYVEWSNGGVLAPVAVPVPR